MDVTKLPISRESALQIGSRWYFTGEPCLHGHIGARYAGTSICTQCNVAAARARSNARRDGRAARLAAARGEYPQLADLPKTRLEARKAGAKLFFTGQPCIRGHVAPRRAKGSCLECDREDGRENYRTERNQVRRAELKANGTIRKYAERYYQKHQDKIRARQAAVPKELRRQWCAAHRKNKLHDGNAIDRERYAQATPAWLTAVDREQIRQVYLDARRKTAETGSTHHVDHIIPINNPDVCGLHVPWNLRVIPKLENLVKNNKLDSVNKSLWESMAPEQIEAYAVSWFTALRKKPFPYYDRRDRNEAIREILIARAHLNAEPAIVGDELVCKRHCLPLAWGFFPHAYDTRCNGTKTPVEAWHDDNDLMRAIHGRLRRGSNISYPGAMRKAIYGLHGVQTVSNFRPIAAAAIYRRYGGGLVLDPCAGWGGRMVGAAIAGNVTKYVGIEPSTKTVAGLQDLGQTIQPLLESQVIQACAEDYVAPGEFDIAFTSPPYFDTEKYSDEPTQSYLRHPTKGEWLEGFLLAMSRNAIASLKPGGLFAINIANPPKWQTLLEEYLLHMKLMGHEPVETLKYLMPSRTGGQKFEPIFVFRTPPSHA